MNTMSPPTMLRLRAEFPSLASDTIYLENAGGSQVPRCVADAIHRYLLHTNVQLGAAYSVSEYCTDLVARAHSFIERFMNAEETGKVILGSSSTALVTMLAACYRPMMKPGDEIVIAECGHEANIGPWVNLAEATGATLKWWKVDPTTAQSSFEDLKKVLSKRTQFVCCTHVSNLLGDIVDVKEVSRMVHEVGARIVVDGVAYAPHRAIDVRAWNVDYYFYSTYKVYGPHMAALYGRNDALAEITGPNHFFIGKDEIPYKFELGGCSHEGCAGLLALQQYLAQVNGADAVDTLSRASVEAAFESMKLLEAPLQTRLIQYLEGHPAVRIVGPAHAESSRVSTISFVHESKSSREISDFVNLKNIGIRYGHMYAYRLCRALKLDPDDGVVRVSAVHYNTVDEVDRLIEVLDEIL